MTDCIESEEAREIAKKLRYTANDDLGGLSLQRNLAEITKAEGVSWRWVMRRLADLIDRPTCRNDDSPFDRSFLCSRCGYEAWTYDDSGCNPSDFSFCPECGAEVVNE